MTLLSLELSEDPNSTVKNTLENKESPQKSKNDLIKIDDHQFVTMS